MMRKNSRTCWNVFRVDRLTVFSPARVIALTVKKSESMYLTLRSGVEAPQKIAEVTKHTPMKYA
jgi:hypothetical protein